METDKHIKNIYNIHVYYMTQYADKEKFCPSLNTNNLLI